MNTNVRDFDPTQGMALQGDVSVMKLPDDYKVNTATEIAPQGNKLVILEGEQTGHHHSVDVLERAPAPTITPTKTSKAVEGLMAQADVAPPTVKYYSDTGAAQEMQKRGILTRADLGLGVLVVQGGGDVGCLLRHNEHDAIRLLAGNYLIGRQIESSFNEERLVRD